VGIKRGAAYRCCLVGSNWLSYLCAWWGVGLVRNNTPERRLMRRRTYLVCQLSQGRALRNGPCNSVKWVLAATENSNLLFSAGKRRREAFFSCLREEFLVMILYRCGAWIAYDWMSRSSTGWPLHLPASIQNLNAYWRFYFRRQDGFWGLCYYKRALRLFAQRTSKACEHASTYVDTRVNIVTSRRSIPLVTFRPKGVIITFRSQIPKVSSYIW
jgi:hypothetical protein